MPLHNLAGNHAQTNVISYLQKKHTLRIKYLLYINLYNLSTRKTSNHNLLDNKV